MKKLLLTLSAITLLSACAQTTPEAPEPAPQELPTDSTHLYTNEEFGFQLTLPYEYRVKPGFMDEWVAESFDFYIDEEATFTIYAHDPNQWGELQSLADGPIPSLVAEGSNYSFTYGINQGIRGESAKDVMKNIDDVIATFELLESEGKQLSISFTGVDPLLTVEPSADSIVMRHTSPYKHHDFCDQRDGIEQIDELTDLEYSFQLYSASSLGEALNFDKNFSYIVEHYEPTTDTLNLAEGFIDPYNAAGFSGYRVTNSVENCGQWRYYFPLENATLVIGRDLGELRSLPPEALAEVAASADIIYPEEEEKIFLQTLEALIVE